MNYRKTMTSGIGLLCSQKSFRAYLEAGNQSSAIYIFKGATDSVRWLKEHYAYLSPNGAASMLRRLCIKFDWLSDADITEMEALDGYHTLFVPDAIVLDRQACQTLAKWVHQGGYLFVVGRTSLPGELLGVSKMEWYRPNGFSGIMFQGHLMIVGYRGYPVSIVQPAIGSEAVGSVCEVLNPQEGPAKADIRSLGPAVIKSGQVLYMALPVFETVGAMLQGHVNSEDMRSWGHRYKYLDWVGRFLKDILETAGWHHLWSIRVKPWGPSPGVVVLRHDVDQSSDTTYLDYERKNQIPATYAILNDRRRQPWIEAVSTHPEAEAAYHFDTSPEGTGWRRLLGCFVKGLSTNPLDSTGGKALWRQFKRARDRLGIPIQTGQRHNAYFTYPEIVDAMNYLYERETEVLGLGTMFRFTNFMYGARSREDERTYVVTHPDTSVPFWFPFKLWYASVENHHSLRGWDITHVLEPEPWLTDYLLSQEEYLEDGVYTLGFHPAHCQGKSFRPEGNWDWFEYAVELGKSKGYLFSTCKEVFKRLTQWEDLAFRFYKGEGWIENKNCSQATICLESRAGELFFSPGHRSVEPLSPTLVKVVLESGDSIRFSLG